VKDHGITTNANYPYEFVTGTCKLDEGEFKISSYVNVT